MSMIGLPGFANPYQVPPPNFIETFFKALMENGYDKIGIAVFLQLYLYMSLSHIQNGFKYLNDKIALYGREKLEQYFIALILLISNIWNFIWACLTSWFFTLPMKILNTLLFNPNNSNKNSISKSATQFYNWLFNKNANVPAINNPIPVTKKAVMNKHVMKLDPTNTVDMNALGHYILSNKRTLALDPQVERTYSARKTTIEAINIPESLVLALQGDIVVQLSHHIGLKYEFETDHVNEKIKRYLCDKITPNDDKTKKTGNKPAQLKEALKKLWGEKNIYSDDPVFWYQKGEWSCDPESMTNTQYTVLWRVLYYHGDVNVIRKFIQYLLGEESFKFDDKIYDKSDEAIEGEFKDVFKDKTNLEGFLAEVPDYHLKFVSNLEEQGVKATIDELSKKFFARYQGGKGEQNSRISITYVSPTFDRYQLAKFARMWFAKLIHQFYDQTTKKSGEKVTIYKLGIIYDTKIEDQPNPKYIQWEKEQAEELRRRQDDQAKQIQAMQIQQQLEKDKQQLAAQALQLQQQQQIQAQQQQIQQQLQLLQQGKGTVLATGQTTVTSIEVTSAAVTSAASTTASTSAASTSAASTSAVTSTEVTSAAMTENTVSAATGSATASPNPNIVDQVLENDKLQSVDKKVPRDARGTKSDKGNKDRSHSRSRSRSRSRGRDRRSRRSKKDNRRYSSSSSSSESEDEAWNPELNGLFDNDFDSYPGPGFSGMPYGVGMGKHQKNKGKKWKNRGNGNGNGNDWIHGSEWSDRSNYKQPPTKTIKVEHKIPSAYAKPIKTDRKPLEYLYLPEQSMESLVEYLRNFKDHRDRFQTFGFPHRGGIILSGAPGCGKSSTILATATYLQKDIFYLDLGQIKTNLELKLCVDYIRTNSSNGGVIIFEDIDCMNEIVHKRPEHFTEMTSETNITKITEEVEGPLSLAYLLNVLDGTMAPEDVIFIMTTNHIEKLDKALIRPGRIDLDIELTKCTRIQLQKIYLDLYSKELPADLVARFPEKHWITARVILHLFHNSFDANIDPEVLIAPLLNTSEDELIEMYDNSD
jgi:hypothetical protein